MKYIFILGRNIELSVKEVESYLERKGNKVFHKDFRDNALLMDVERPLMKDAVDSLGGVLRIGKVLFEVSELEDKPIYFGYENNFSYVIWDFSDKIEEVSDLVKKKFRSEKLKATEKKLKNLLSLQEGEKAQSVSSSLVTEEYFVFDDYFGQVVQKCDYKKLEKRDMEKPVRRESLSISPRLAKIMINLSGVKSGEKLVDGFCGIGVVLQEGLIQKLKVVGVDKDRKAIEGAKDNLKWFGFSKKNYDLFGEDSSKAEIPKGNVFVSEPDLGDVLKKIPTKEKAEEMERRFEGLMIKVLNNMKNYVSGKFVFTAPLIRIGKKRVGCDFEKISEKTGLSLVEGFPIPEFRGNQIVGRDVVVFESK